MSTNTARITYLYNSGFAVETDEQILLFDYCPNKPVGEGKMMTSGIVTIEDLALKPSVTVLVSHVHIDHFNPAILRWRSKRKDINYVFSNDIPAGKSAILLGPGDSVVVSGMQVNAFPSTDAGVSYLVEVDGLSIYHAGDLNLWNWSKESAKETKFIYRKAKYAFLKALAPLQNHKLDIAFFPLDPQIGDCYDDGALYFTRTFRPRLFVPMHFGERYDVCQTFLSQEILPGVEVFRISAPGQQYEYQQSR